VIWEPFILALVLGLIVSAGLYFAYLWPSVEPVDEPAASPEPPEPGHDATSAAAPIPPADDAASSAP
jgi:hypothetical protein